MSAELVTSSAAATSAMQALQAELSALPQYQPRTRHYFHGGMYCREVWRDAGVLVVGAVHKREHFYMIVSGVVLITDGADQARQVAGPCLIESMPGTKRAVYAVTATLCMTFHRTDAKTVEQAEADLVEADPAAMFGLGNVLKPQALQHELQEKLQ